MAIWYILQQFGIFYVHLVYFSSVGMLHQETFWHVSSAAVFSDRLKFSVTKIVCSFNSRLKISLYTFS
jgi:hypothetical protein